MITHRPPPVVHGRVCVWMSHGECARVCVRVGMRSLCVGCVCTDALALVGVCSQAPGTDRNTNVTPNPTPRRHLCNRCTYHKPCVTLSTPLSLSDTLVFVSLVCFVSRCLGGVVCFCLIRRVFVFNLPLSPPSSLFMKLEHLKDCCVFVNNKSSVHFVLVKSLVQPLLLQPTSPRTRGLCFMSPSFFGVNVWDQTLFSGCARVTLTTKTPPPSSSG